LDKIDKKQEKIEKKLEKAEKKSEKAEKKLEKLEKKAEKAEKKQEKTEKKSDKSEKKSEKNVKSDKKVDKSLSYESVGISNMSFEDQTLEDFRKAACGGSRHSISSPDEEGADLRTSGATRFGSLKRGINPFSKLSNRI
jgi:predicted  nucleic acid-binding Zn-ribbon protein